MKKIIFVTGTDTGVGKTLLSAILLYHLRHQGVHALAMKPFCSGGRADVRRLQALQPGELADAEMNPFYFDKPLAPLAAAGKKKAAIQLVDVAKRINKIADKCECLVVEGSGGLLVPLGEGFTVLDLIAVLDCEVIVAARNRLGTINHTLLTIHALKTAGIAQRKLLVVLMDPRNPELSAQTNPGILSQLLHPIPLVKVPFLGPDAANRANLGTNYPKIRGIVTKLLQ